MARTVNLSFKRRTQNQAATVFVVSAFLVALVPLGSVLFTTVKAGMERLDTQFFTHSMKGIIGEGGGVLHALVGTGLITIAATLIAVPIGVLTAIYVVEYATKPIRRAITFLVDVMSGIPSIVAGLFAYAAFSMILGPGTKLGISGALALAVLMLPTVVRSSEEVLRLVPADVKEAALALGSPKWVMVLKVLLPTAFGGIVTGILLGISRIVGETAPLLIAAGFTANMNYNLFADRMQTLPVFVYTQISNQGNPAEAFEARAWSAALVLILFVVALNLLGKFIASRLNSAKI